MFSPTRVLRIYSGEGFDGVKKQVGCFTKLDSSRNVLKMSLVSSSWLLITSTSTYFSDGRNLPLILSFHFYGINRIASQIIIGFSR